MAAAAVGSLVSRANASSPEAAIVLMSVETDAGRRPPVAILRARSPYIRSLEMDSKLIEARGERTVAKAHHPGLSIALRTDDEVALSSAYEDDSVDALNDGVYAELVSGSVDLGPGRGKQTFAEYRYFKLSAAGVAPATIEEYTRVALAITRGAKGTQDVVGASSVDVVRGAMKESAGIHAVTMLGGGSSIAPGSERNEK